MIALMNVLQYCSINSNKGFIDLSYNRGNENCIYILMTLACLY